MPKTIASVGPLCLEGARAGGAKDIARNTLVIFGHEHALGADRGVATGIDMADQFRIAIEMRGIGACIAGRETNPI